MNRNGAEGRLSAALRSTHPSSLKHGFTLIELLVVTVIIVALMGVMFRLTGLVGSTSERERTIERMQKLENCLSGYYAAFGQYPPVPLQGASHDIFRKICDLHQMQYEEEDDSVLDEKRVRAACRAQPVAAEYPPAKNSGTYGSGMSADDLVEAYREAVNEYYNAVSSGSDPKQSAWANSPLGYSYLQTQGKSDFESETDFTKFQMFRFGLMSFLLPRYRFMLECARSGGYYDTTIDECKQWTAFNVLPARMDTGVSFMTWGSKSGSSSKFISLLSTKGTDDIDETQRWEIDLIPSQAACARWMANLAGIVSGPSNSFFGVMIADDSSNIGINSFDDADTIQAPYSLGGHGTACGGGNPYILFKYTVKDGWKNDFYYYCPPPYQSYILWSSGAYDDLTFPPWIDLNEFRSQYGDKFYSKALQWSADDIVFMGTGEKN